MRNVLVLALMTAAVAAMVPAASAQVGGQPYIGEILLAAFNFAPQGWALCNGQLMAIQQNTALFSLLGTSFGGDGVHTFALPDLRGRSPISSGQGPGLSPYSVGQTGDQETVTLNLDQMPRHNHTAFGSTNTATTASPSGAVWATQSRLTIFSSTTDGSVMLAGGTAGGGQAHDNRSPYLTLTYIIALEGIYPSQQ